MLLGIGGLGGENCVLEVRERPIATQFGLAVLEHLTNYYKPVEDYIAVWWLNTEKNHFSSTLW